MLQQTLEPGLALGDFENVFDAPTQPVKFADLVHAGHALAEIGHHHCPVLQVAMGFAVCHSLALGLFVEVATALVADFSAPSY